MTNRVHNFAPGPAALPEPVLEQAREELLDCRGSGMSAMELPHRGDLFKEIAAEAEADLRDLLDVPEDYAVLFMQGGATLHAGTVAMNLGARGRNAAYVDTGHWAAKAMTAAKPYLPVEVCGSAAASRYTDIVPADDWTVGEGAAYVHYIANETIGGVEYDHVPQCDAAPLVADITSDALSRPLDVTRFGVLYAGAQKNIGPAGMTLVIARRDLLGAALPVTPRVLDYALQDEAKSMLNTPPTWSWYVSGLVFKWLKAEGGLGAMEAVNRRKAALLYGHIDSTDFYSNPVARRARSLMSVPFTLAEPSLDSVFLREADEQGLKNLKGHRSVGGMRASLYNAVSEAGVAALVEFMRNFEKQHG